MAESEEELKNLLMKVKEECGLKYFVKAGVKLNIKKPKIMASDPVSPWQIERERVEEVIDFIFLVSKITKDSDCSHEIKRPLLLGRKAMTNLDSDITFLRHQFADKGPYSQSYGFSSSRVQM